MGQQEYNLGHLLCMCVPYLFSGVGFHNLNQIHACNLFLLPFRGLKCTLSENVCFLKPALAEFLEMKLPISALPLPLVEILSVLENTELSFVVRVDKSLKKLGVQQ